MGRSHVHSPPDRVMWRRMCADGDVCAVGGGGGQVGGAGDRRDSKAVRAGGGGVRAILDRVPLHPEQLVRAATQGRRRREAAHPEARAADRGQVLLRGRDGCEDCRQGQGESRRRAGRALRGVERGESESGEHGQSGLRCPLPSGTLAAA
eukprot:1209620-Rhodomonas_salina.1